MAAWPSLPLYKEAVRCMQRLIAGQRLVLPRKSRRLVSAWQRLMASAGSYLLKFFDNCLLLFPKCGFHKVFMIFTSLILKKVRYELLHSEISSCHYVISIKNYSVYAPCSPCSRNKVVQVNDKQPTYTNNELCATVLSCTL